MASIFLGLNVLRGEYMQRNDKTLKIYDLDRALPLHTACTIPSVFMTEHVVCVSGKFQCKN